MTGATAPSSSDKPAAPAAAEDDFEKAFNEFSDARASAPAEENTPASPEPAPAPSASEPPKAPEPAPAPAAAAPAAATPGDKPAAAAAAAAPPNANDIWAQAPPELKAAYDAVQSRVTQLEQLDSTQRGRISKLMKDMKALNEMLEGQSSAPATGSDAPNKGASAPAPAKGKKSLREELLEDPELKKVREEFPEVAVPYEKLLGRLADRLEGIEGTVSTVKKNTEEDVLEREGRVLIEAHPDYPEAIASNAFQIWLYRAPKEMQEIAMANGDVVRNGKAVATLMENFKKDTNWTGSGAATAPAAAPAAATPQPSPTSTRRERAASAVVSEPPKAATPTVAQAPGAADPFEAAFNEFADKRARRKSAA